jgi:hypothetical protein
MTIALNLLHFSAIYIKLILAYGFRGLMLVAAEPMNPVMLLKNMTEASA